MHSSFGLGLSLDLTRNKHKNKTKRQTTPGGLQHLIFCQISQISLVTLLPMVGWWSLVGFLPILEFLRLPKTNIAREKSGWETIFFWEGLFSRVMLVSGKTVKFPHSKPTSGSKKSPSTSFPPWISPRSQ